MMESYDETRHLDNRKVMQVEEILGLKIQNDLNVLNGVELNDNNKNMDFGAEIVAAEMLPNEDEIKTNLTKITHTEEEQTDSLRELSTTSLNELLCDLEEQVHDIRRDHHDNNDDTNSIPQFFKGFVNLPKPNGVADDEDDGNDYQSDENDNELNDDPLENSDDNNGPSREDDTGEDTSTDSDFSDLSGLSDISGRDWKPIQTHPLNWVQKQINSGANPRVLLSQMLPSSSRSIAPGLNDMTLWRILASMLSEPPRRQKLRYINTLEDVLNLIQQSKNIMVLTGAGVSVSCGIPDFRSSDGIYARLAKDYPDLPDPQAMFDINYFSRDPRPFFKFAREIYPGQFKPSPCHRFIKLLEEKKKLLRNYTQNIDTLEQVAGIQNVIECHGSFSTASCTKCKYKCDADAIRADIFAQCIPVCPRCQPNVQQSVDASEPVSEFELKQLVQNGIMKPDIVFFGEGLPELFHTVMASDKDKCDLLIVIGSSLKVRPVALIPSSIPAHVPQILINREQLHHLEFDVELLGDSDVIINQLCHRLGENWRQICFDDAVLQESNELLPLEEFVSVDGDGDDYVRQLQDVDTQSVQSSASTDIVLRSVGVSSDSGCDTSSSAVTKTDSVESPLDAIPIDFSSPDFRPFVERLGNETNTAYPLNSRHMSVDSAKDSDMQCDSSTSTMPAGISIGAPVVPITNFNASGATIPISPNNDVASGPSSYTKSIDESDMKIIASNSDCTLKQRRRRPKRVSVADRLLEGTYYRHNNSYSYVFPGALVSLRTDSDDEDDDSEEEIGEDNLEDEKLSSGDFDGAPLSPLLPPSVEAEMVSEIATTVTAAPRKKRLSSDDSASAATSPTTDQQLSDACNTIGLISPPPTKRRRESVESPITDDDTIGMAAETVASIAAQLETDVTKETTTTIRVNDESEQIPNITLEY